MNVIKRVAWLQNPWCLPALHLMWLGFLFLPLAGGAMLGWGYHAELMPTVLAVALYVPLHFFAFYRTGPALWVSRVLTFGIGVWLLPHNFFAHTFWLYAGLPPERASHKASMTGMVAAAIAAFAVGQVYSLPGAYLGIYDGLLFGIGMAILGARAAQASRDALSAKDVEIARLAKVAERERIARDVHDLLGHTLSVITLKAELASKLATRDPERAAAEMADVANVSRQAMQEVRQAIVGLRSMGLSDAIRSADAMLTAAGIETALDLGPLPTLVATTEHALAQAVLEACTNIVRHANASRVRVSVLPRAGQVVLQVEDNGRGCDATPGNGLTGMRERLTAVGGSLSIHLLSPGTRLVADVPLVANVPAR